MTDSDFLSYAKCKNCVSFKDGRCLQRRVSKDLITGEETYEITSADGTCSIFQDRAKNDLEAIREAYLTIKDILEDYLDLSEDYKEIIALWIIGTYYHKQFNCYPYLFFNAMRGSGKTRILKMIKAMAHKGKIMGSLSETTLFRSAGVNTLLFDEFEGIGGKDKGNLRELLNAGYKKGMVVERFKQNPKSKEWESEEFEVYTPIAMANIWGMESVLSDRCISVQLEKSNNKRKINMVEDFDTHKTIKKVVTILSQCSLCSVVTRRNTIDQWNSYLKIAYPIYTNDTNNINNNNYTNYTNNTLLKKINDLDVNGRDLELYFPLIEIKDIIDPENLDSFLNIIKSEVSKKKSDDLLENLDISLYNFIGERLYLDMVNRHDSFISIALILNKFREYLDSDDEHINTKWMGRALKRLNLVRQKRRIAMGNEVILNFDKAKEKLKMFK